MKVNCVMRHRDNVPSIWPSDQACLDHMMKIKTGTQLVLDVKRVRNPGYHRRAFKIFQRLYELSDDRDTDFEAWRKWLTIMAGFFKEYYFPDGSVHVEPESLSFESMSQDKFEKVFTKMHQVFVTHYGERLTMDELNEWASM